MYKNPKYITAVETRKFQFYLYFNFTRNKIFYLFQSLKSLKMNLYHFILILENTFLCSLKYLIALAWKFRFLRKFNRQPGMLTYLSLQLPADFNWNR